ncbi:PAS domain-containing sensor histidine kinase [Roseateles puraquae]|uniref:PAS domain-containing sensor histidine kinase n=1 Tax=Roseateles puraquae TaxID=431059 RepID=UPI0031DCC194
MEAVQAALDGIEQPAFATDGQGQVCAVNEDFVGLLSMDVGGNRHAAWQQCLGPEGLTRWQRGIEAGVAFAEVLRPFQALGRWRYRASPVLRDGEGRRCWLVTLVRESLDDPLDDNLIKLSLHAAVRAGRMGLWEWNPATGDCLWSPEMYDVFRLPRGSGLEPGERFLHMIHPDDAPRIDAAVAAAAARGGIDPFVFRIRAGDGSQRWIMSCSRTERAPGQPLTRLVGVNFDVTDTVEAEQRLDAERLERARQEQIMRAVMAYAPVGIAVALKGENELAYVSRFGAEMVGATPEQSRTWGAWQLRCPDTKVLARPQDLPLARACEGQVIRDEAWLMQAMDGRLIPVNCNAGPIHDEQGAVVGGTVVWYDVTPFKQAERQRDLFLAAVSHELRTPLSAILAWAETLQRGSRPDLLERGLAAIARNVLVQSRLVDDLLDVTRIAAGKMAMTPAQEDMGRIVHAAIETVSPIAASAQVVLAQDLTDAPLPVMADELRLRQAVWNLLTNAVKFSRAGGLVQVTLRAEPGWAQLDVTDHGVGIEPAQLAHVFDQFWQAGSRDSGRSEGLGLGLAIAMHIVRGHRGELRAHSDGVGRGATFTLRLPLHGDSGVQQLSAEAIGRLP